MRENRAVVLLSGGLDSSTLLYALKRQEGREVLALSVIYGQRHVRELRAAADIASALAVSHRVVDLSLALASVFENAESSQVGKLVDVPEGHYAEESMKLTIVPNRNMLLLAVAGAYALSNGAGVVAYAAHAGDHFIYPDCRPEFIRAAGDALWLGSDLTLVDPFSSLTKADIVSAGASLSVPFELTYSCYKGGEDHCGVCGTCNERREAFKLAGIEDPTKYLS